MFRLLLLFMIIPFLSCSGKKNKQAIKLAIASPVRSLDPGVGVESPSCHLIKMLYEGLMRVGPKGEIIPGVAESFTTSEDQKTYTFKLRESYWSNGDPVVAYDFEYAWKKILQLPILSPFSYPFYSIKNARAVKNMQASIDEVGITTVDEKTIVVELEHPTSYFLELIASSFYAPINHRIDDLDPKWLLQKNEHFVCNGPFKQKNPSAGCLHDLEKSPPYWNHDNILINQITFKRLSMNSSITMFKKK